MSGLSVAFIGLGHMGLPMASRLVSAGYELKVFDLDRGRMAQLAGLGAETASSAAAAARGAELICTILPADQQVKSALLGFSGVVSEMRSGTCLIDFSTISPETFRWCAGALPKSCDCFDAAVGPGPEAAKAGLLTVLTGGDASLIERWRPVLEIVGSRVIHCGGLGAAKAVKIANNLVTGISVLMNCEAMILARKAGADPAILAEVMKGTLANNRIGTEIFVKHVLSRSFDFGAGLGLMRKDMLLAKRLAEDNGSPFSLGQAAFEVWDRALAERGADGDFLQVVQMLESEYDSAL